MIRGTLIVATRLYAMGTFRDRGEQVGPPEQANYSVLNWKVTCARRVNLVARHSGRLPLDSVGTTTKDTKVTKMEFDELSNRMSGCAIAVHWHVGPELKDGIERFLL